jgi:hypothetical protein
MARLDRLAPAKSLAQLGVTLGERVLAEGNLKSFFGDPGLRL